MRQEFFTQMEIPEGELEEIFSEIEKAKETIRYCYLRLQRLGVVTIRKKEADGETPTASGSDQSASNSSTSR